MLKNLLGAASGTFAMYRAYFIAAAYAVACALIFGAGWTVNGWRLSGQLENQRAGYAEARATALAEAAQDLAESSKTIREAAVDYSQIQDKLTGQIAQLRKDFKNAQKPPLPVDCKPDPVRVRHLESAIGEANKAATGR